MTVFAWAPAEQVIADGVRRRAQVPVGTLTAYHPAPGRADPVRIVEETNQGRVPELVPIRVGRMIASPFAFLRGAAAVMAADLSSSPGTGIRGHICGDAHAANFGLYASPERRQVMDVVDFDEATVGPWDWDLKRLVTSLVVAGREAGVDDGHCRLAARDCAWAYRAAVREVAHLPLIEGHVMTTDHSTLEQFGVADLVETFDRVRRKARRNTSRKVAAKFTQRPAYDAWRFVEDPPILTHVPDATAAEVVAGLETYVATLGDEMSCLIRRYAVVDVAHRIVGVGSVGLRNYLVLLHGNTDEALVLQVKQARASALARYVGASAARHEGERVFEGQRWMQTVSDVLLGWTTAAGQPFIVRQFRNMKGSIDVTRLKAAELDDYARVVGVVLARAHTQSIDPRVLQGYCGADHPAAGEEFDVAFAGYAVAYADQIEADHAALMAAVKAGRLPAVEGI